MLATHLFGLIPLLVLFILALIFYSKGLVVLTALGYDMALSWMAVANQWEMVFFPICALIFVITAIIFGLDMARGNWL